MSKRKNDGKEYQEYTRNILNNETVRKDLEDKFNLSGIYIKPEAPLLGNKSGTTWNVDAYGRDINNRLLIIECKHHKTSINQNIIAAFAYIIKDVGAYLGIVVTTKRLQKGAIKVADAENIQVIEIDYNPTTENFFMRFPQHNQLIGVVSSEIPGSSFMGFNSTSETVAYPFYQGEIDEKAANKENEIE